MKFSDLARAQSQLRQKALQKEAGVIGTVLRGATALPRAMARGAMNRHGKILGGLMVGGAALGTVGAAKSAIGKGRKYNRGFDPRIQDASMQRIR